ncbi:MAG: HNH endonuclease signature motif containing protein [Spiroplasma sp.]|nr:HNH endonuclease signature motif containing protein [Spiroplasma sp.]
MELNDRTLKAWNKSDNCNCVDQDCIENHKLCGICQGTIVFTAHVSNQPNSKYAWNIDHKQEKSQGGKTILKNLQAVHVSCNQKKSNKR